MIFNRPRAAKKKRLTWYLNAFISYNAIDGAEYNVPFTSNENRFNWIFTSSGSQSASLEFRETRYGGVQQVYSIDRWGVTGHWYNEAYRTITFDAEPTGELLTWLQANVTPL